MGIHAYMNSFHLHTRESLVQLVSGVKHFARFKLSNLCYKFGPWLQGINDYFLKFQIKTERAQ